MRMKRSMYKMETKKHKKLMKKLIADDMTFNEFMNRIIFMYLEDKYDVEAREENEEKNEE
ncbi:MAG: hypothetical protein ACOCQ1_00770 [Halanaerobiaceae bacterium]